MPHHALPHKITLQELRERLDVTQEMLAEASGVNRYTIGDIEKDPEHAVRLTTATRLLTAINRLRDSRELPFVCIEHVQWHLKGVGHLASLCTCCKPQGLRAIRARYDIPVKHIMADCHLSLAVWYKAALGLPVSQATAAALLDAVNNWLLAHGQPLVYLTDLALNIRV